MPLLLKILVAPEIMKKKSSNKLNQINVKIKDQKWFLSEINRYLHANKAQMCYFPVSFSKIT